MYCKEFDHTIEQCSQLIAKWQARTVINPNPVKNPNPNPNPNIQMISSESRQPNLVVVRKGGVAIGENQNTPQGYPQV